MDMLALQALPMLAGVLAAALTMLWIGVHVFGLIRLASRLDAVSRDAKIAWALSAAGGFMGPCVIMMALIGMSMAIAERRRPDATDATQQAAGYILLAGAIILVMAAVLLAGVGISVAVS